MKFSSINNSNGKTMGNGWNKYEKTGVLGIDKLLPVHTINNACVGEYTP